MNEAGAQQSDLSLTVEELDILEVDCLREQKEMKEAELKATLALGSLRRKLRSVAQELDYLRILRSTHTNDSADCWLTEPLAVTEEQPSVGPDTLRLDISSAVTRYRARSVMGTLTMRRNRLLLERAKSLKLDEN